MKQQLGQRCPECGAGDAPVLRETHGPMGKADTVTCVRCGHYAVSYTTTTAALRAFYGPQDEAALPVCGVMPELIYYDEADYYYEATGDDFRVTGRRAATPEEARTKWNKLIGGGK